MIETTLEELNLETSMKLVRKYCVIFLSFVVSRKFRERDPTEEILKAFRLFDDDKDGNVIFNQEY